MSHRQLFIQAIGSTNEAYCEALLGRIASMIPVPREHDFGIDYYCLPREPVTARTETVVALAGIQVKGESEPFLEFGGLDAKSGSWQKHELEWFRNVRLPLYLAVVAASAERVHLYSITRCLQVFWKTEYPFKIRCETSAPDFSSPHSTHEPTSVVEVPATAEHDGKVWNVQLGVPFLSLKWSELEDPRQRVMLRKALMSWIEADQYSLDNLALGVPVVRLPQSYFTNIPAMNFQVIMFWHPGDGGRARGIAERLIPGFEALVRQLLSEGRRSEAEKWQSALEWCRGAGLLSELGEAALRELSSP